MSAPTVISTRSCLQSFLSQFTNQTSLYVDLEGTNLGRHGTLSLITVLLLPQDGAFIIDVLTLGAAAFTTSAPCDASPSLPHSIRDGDRSSCSSNTEVTTNNHSSSPSSNSGTCSVRGSSPGRPTTLQSVLEDPEVDKFFWDVRSDADALWALHGVRLRGAFDVQLLENITRPAGRGGRRFVRGLDACVWFDLPVSEADKHDWIRVKKEIRARMLGPASAASAASAASGPSKRSAPSGGGDCDGNDQGEGQPGGVPEGPAAAAAVVSVFDERPLAAKTISYCVGDVRALVLLRDVYMRRLLEEGEPRVAEKLRMVRAETEKRLQEAWAEGYDSSGKDKAVGRGQTRRYDLSYCARI